MAADPTTPIERLKTKLMRRPEIKFRESQNSIEILPANDDGFTIYFSDDGIHITVGFDGWHDHFDSVDDAIECVGFGLSNECRLRIDLYGGNPYRWTVEEWDGTIWKEESQTGLIFFPFWRRRSTIHRQNRILLRDTDPE